MIKAPLFFGLQCSGRRPEAVQESSSSMIRRESKYRVNERLGLKITSDGGFKASCPPSEGFRKADERSLQVLRSLGRPILLEDAWHRLNSRPDWTREAFEQTCRRLAKQGWIVACDGASPVVRPEDVGFSSIFRQLALLQDTFRVLSYASALGRHCRGKVVMDLGCGTGILSLLAIQSGARRVIAVEETAIAELAAEMFRANGCGEQVELHAANSREVVLEERVDVLVHELIGVDPFEEGLLASVDDARRRFLKPKGRLIPSRLEVCCAGLEVVQQTAAKKEKLLRRTQETALTYGLNFKPLLDCISGLDERLFQIPIELGPPNDFKPRILSEECRLFDLDLRRPLDEPELLGDPELMISKNGILGGVILYFRACLDRHTRLTTSPDMDRTSWGWNARHLSRLAGVKKGQRVPLTVALRGQQGRPCIRVDLSLPSDQQSTPKGEAG